MSAPLKAPYPYFGGKSRVADIVWARFGDVKNYVEPFFGSGAVMLARPTQAKIETVNDMDAYLCNFWRALQAEPDEVARWCDWPVSELDLHARHRWLKGRTDFVEKMRSDPDFYDVKIAGWWVWGICSWIGDNWSKENTTISIPALGSAVGINRGSLSESPKSRPHLGRSQGIHSGSASSKLYTYINELSERIRRVRVCCGDWTRVVTDAATVFHGETAIFFDPPYFSPSRSDVYNHDSRQVSKDVESWCINHASDPRLKLALCGYEGDYILPGDWECVAWVTEGMYRKNARSERIWFSPHCLNPDRGLWDFE